MMYPNNNIPTKTPMKPKLAYMEPKVSNGHEVPSKSLVGIGGLTLFP